MCLKLYDLFHLTTLDLIIDTKDQMLKKSHN